MKIRISLSKSNAQLIHVTSIVFPYSDIASHIKDKAAYLSQGVGTLGGGGSSHFVKDRPIYVVIRVGQKLPLPLGPKNNLDLI